MEQPNSLLKLDQDTLSLLNQMILTSPITAKADSLEDKVKLLIDILSAQPLPEDCILKKDVDLWTNYNDLDQISPNFEIEVIDRTKLGYVTVDVGEKGNFDSILSANFEISHIPGTQTETQVLHVHFDMDNLAFSIYKMADEYIIRMEAGVYLNRTKLPNCTSDCFITHSPMISAQSTALLHTHG